MKNIATPVASKNPAKLGALAKEVNLSEKTSSSPVPWRFPNT
jgi:hypothetical protein